MININLQKGKSMNKDITTITAVDVFNYIADLGADIERVEEGRKVKVTVTLKGKSYECSWEDLFKLGFLVLKDLRENE